MKTTTTLILMLLSSSIVAQKLEPTESKVLYNLYLKCNEGGVFANQEVIFTNQSDKSSITCISDAGGVVRVLLDVGNMFEYRVKNFSESRIVTMPNEPYMFVNNTLRYSRNDIQFVEKFKMNSEQIKTVELAVKSLPDTTYFNSIKTNSLKLDQNFSSMNITLKDLKRNPLVGEMITVSGRKYKKHFKGPTDLTGSIIFLLPKGDIYDISFKHDPNYDIQEINYTLGAMKSTMQIDYLGSREIERRLVLKEKQLKEEMIRLEKERKDFEEYMKREKISILDARKKEIKEYETGKRSFSDDVILKVFERNKHWKDKLIVCDLTGSMSPYGAQLEIWYKLNLTKEQNLQFVFFNDGDRKQDHDKKIGSTGGIYYSKAKGVDELITLMTRVQAGGDGGDCPENNMEALIKGSETAAPYKELIMIADNHAPVKDIILLETFKIPVKIILCGVGDEIEADYLRLAWKTKGSVHTMEEDILSIGKLLDGQEIKINGQTYRLMKNKFIRMEKA
ncbi:MAG: hypothetical protein V4580_11010 [Bacteroidota bacterium]